MITGKSKATDEAQIRKLIEDRAKAVREKDINGLMHHASDVLLFDVIDPLQYTGKDAVKKRAEEWFDVSKLNRLRGSRAEHHDG